MLSKVVAKKGVAPRARTAQAQLVPVCKTEDASFPAIQSLIY
jgi:hypothetical protein